MADLSNTEKHNFEKLFAMSSGYVLSFSNRTFADFVFDSTGRNIYDNKYALKGDSKANRLRAFWTVEPNAVVAKLLGDLLQHIADFGVDSSQEHLFQSCQHAVQRLANNAPVPDIDAIVPNAPEEDFATLAKAVREAIEKNEPGPGLDRLHTFVVKFMRVVCEAHGITIERDKPLHSLVGEYLKCLRAKGCVESEMTERILKSSISTLEAFNKVRNDQSFAHDNRLLNYDESVLIFSHVAATVRFVQAVESRLSAGKRSRSAGFKEDDDIQF